MPRARRATKGETIQARVLPKSKEIIRRYAEGQGVTDSEVVRRLIDEFARVLESRQQKQEPAPPLPGHENGVLIGGR